MKKIDKTILNETAYIAAWVLILSLLMQAVFLICRIWDYTVLLGNLLSAAVSVLNFFLMGLTIQSATVKAEKEARAQMKVSQSMRTFMLFAAAALGVLAPCFNIASSLIPLFFPRIAIAARPLFLNKTERGDTREE